MLRRKITDQLLAWKNTPGRKPLIIKGCRQCGKTTWAGCGQHVDQVMRGVPKAQQCPGHADEPSEGGFFRKLFGR